MSLTTTAYDYKTLPYALILSILEWISYANDEGSTCFEGKTVKDFFGYFDRDPTRKAYQIFCRTYETYYSDVYGDRLPHDAYQTDENQSIFPFVPKRVNITIYADEFVQYVNDLAILDSKVCSINATRKEKTGDGEKVLRLYVTLESETLSTRYGSDQEFAEAATKFLDALNSVQWSKHIKVIINQHKEDVKPVTKQLLQLASLPIVERINIADAFYSDDFGLVDETGEANPDWYGGHVVALLEQFQERSLSYKVHAPYVITYGLDSLDFWKFIGPRVMTLDVRKPESWQNMDKYEQFVSQIPKLVPNVTCLRMPPVVDLSDFEYSDSNEEDQEEESSVEQLEPSAKRVKLV